MTTVGHRGAVAVEIVGAIALTIYSVTASVSFAALIFTGPVASGLPRGAATFLLASGLITVLLGARTKFPVVFGVVQDTAAIVLVPSVATIVANGSDDPVRDVFVVLALSSSLTGATMWAIGRARLGGASRFMPTTVVAGFLAGTGWLLFKGGFDVMTGQTLMLGDLGEVVNFDLARFWLPGAALGLVVAAVPLLARLSPMVSSVITVLSVAMFFVVVAAASSIDAVEAGGWLLGPFPKGAGVEIVVGDVANADWSAVSSASGQIGVVLMLSTLGVLLNISGIQSVLKHRVDLDAELRTVGIANLAIAPIGGLVGYHGLGDSSLAERLGVRRRWVAVAVGSMTMVVALTGGSTIGYLPKFAAGGLLIGAGLGLLIDWVRELRATPAWLDRAVSALILAVICFVGILEGIVVGIVAACVFFVIRYSRLDAVRVVSNGLERRSVVEREPEQADRLAALADRLAVYELHGSLFFGSVSGVASMIRDRLARESSPLDVVILDFERVTDIDSSAFAALAELRDDIGAAGSRTVWSALGVDDAAVLLRADGLASDAMAGNLDAALEIAEDHLLDANPLIATLADEAESKKADSYSPQLLAHFAVRFVAADEIVMHEGDASDELLVVVQGSVHVSRRDRTGREIRLRTSRAGSILGEIGFLTEAVRSATVTAQTDVELRVLSRAAHDELRSAHPDLAIELYDRVLRGTADRAAAIHASLTQALR